MVGELNGFVQIISLVLLDVDIEEIDADRPVYL